MKKAAIIGVISLCAAGIMTAVLLRGCNTVLPPSSWGETFAPDLISDEAWRESIAKDPSAHGYSGYSILKDRNSDAAIPEGLRDLKSKDAYVWLNAALYLGSRKRPEAVPYLIKALRHSAWRSDEETVRLLQGLTGQTFGNEFKKWRDWYETQQDRIELDWDSSLGSSPR